MAKVKIAIFVEAWDEIFGILREERMTDIFPSEYTTCLISEEKYQEYWQIMSEFNEMQDYLLWLKSESK